MRINARLSDEYDKKIEYLKQYTHANMTEILKNSLDLYYQHIKQQSEYSGKKLLQSSFIGCAEADPDLSANYKQLLTESLVKKYDHR